MAVDHRRGWRFLDDRSLRAGYDMSGLDAVDISRDRDHPVRVVAGEIGADAANRHGVGFLVRRTGGLEQHRANARETVGLHDRHGVPRLTPAPGGGSCLLSPAWSQSDGVRASGKIPKSRS